MGKGLVSGTRLEETGKTEEDGYAVVKERSGIQSGRGKL